MKDVLVPLPVGDNPPTGRLLYGTDVRDGLRLLEPGSVHMVATSPPYYGLRDYGTARWEGGDETCVHTVRSASAMEGSRRTSTLGGGKSTVGHAKEGYKNKCGRCGAVRQDEQIGLESSHDLYVEHLVEVFREVRRVLRDDGVVWLNLGDSFASTGGTGQSRHWDGRDKNTETQSVRRGPSGAIKVKDLMGIPWRVALALQADGWWLRNAITWYKPNPMPSPVQDRLSTTYEQVFLLAKSARYFFDLDAIRVPHTFGTYDAEGAFTPAQTWNEDPEVLRKMDQTEGQLGTMAGPPRKFGRGQYNPGGKNPGDVWSIPTQPFPGSHFAVWPQAIPERCIRAGTSEYGVCSKCGAPWRRVVERDDEQGNTSSSGGKKAVASQNLREAGGVGRLDGGRRSMEGSTFHNNPHKRKHPDRTFLGWEPACSCKKAEVRRAVVLDPFSGSGTTGRVALRLGRDYVGVDLNEEYLPMAIARLRDDPVPEKPEPPPAGSVLDVFGVEDEP